MRRWGRFALLGVLAVLLLTACVSGAPRQNMTQVEVFYAVDLSDAGDVDSICSETREIQADPDDVKSAKAILKLLIGGPQSINLISPFPVNTQVLSCTIDDRRALVNMSERYGELSGIELTIADYCITMSLCQMESIDTVSVMVEGKLLPYRDRQVFSMEDALLNSKMGEPLTVEASLYFVDSNSGLLAVEERTLEVFEGETTAGRIIEALLEGPELSYLHTPMPKGTKLLSISNGEGICKVNLSAEFIENRPSDWQTQQLVVYSIVNSMTSFDGLEKVQLMVEGEMVDYFGNVPIGIPLTYNEWITRSNASAQNRN